jgi:CRP/FNR family cyclic AMP-dependent transcriptional regulator
MAVHDSDHFDHKAFIAANGGSILKYDEGKVVFAQGDPANALFYIIEGTLEVTVNSEFGKEGVIAVLKPGDFFGEGCLDGQLLQTSSIVATSKCEIARFDASTIKRVFGIDAAFARLFLVYILERNEALKATLVDHLFNSSEKRLARILLTLASIELGSKSEYIIMPVDQETLAKMVGTTRSRISTFMNKFRKMGYIEYNGKIKVHNSLLNVILREISEPHTSPG